MSLLSSIAGALQSAVAPFYWDGTVAHVTRTDDGHGGGTTSEDTEACKVQIDDYSDNIRAANNYADTDVRLIVLNRGLASPVKSNDRVTVDGKTYAMIGVRQDPAQAYFEGRGVRWSS